MKYLKKAKWSYVLVSVLMIVLGIVLIGFPEISMVSIATLTGILLALFGLIKLISYFTKDIYRVVFQFDLAAGIFTLLAGILIALHPGGLIALLPVLLGVFVLMDGVVKIQTSAEARRYGFGGWWQVLILAILICAGGFLLIVNPFAGAVTLAVFLGIILVLDGIQNLCVLLYISRAYKKMDKDKQTCYVEFVEK